MATKRRFWVSLALLFAFAGLLAPRPVAGQGSAAMAVDAISGGAIDSARTVTGSGPFDIDIVVTSTSEPYKAEQYKLQWDAAVLAYDAERPANLDGLSLCGQPTAGADTVWNGCAATEPTTATGVVHTVTLHCVQDGTSPLHLVSIAEDSAFGTALATGPGTPLATSLTDAQITCGEGGAPPPPPGASPTPGLPAPTPSGPVPTPTPLPPGAEAIGLAGGCNPLASTYPDDTPIQTIAGGVGPEGILTALWQYQAGTWLAYSPQFPDVSDLTEMDRLDVVFICVSRPGDFVRPIV